MVAPSDHSVIPADPRQMQREALMFIVTGQIVKRQVDRATSERKYVLTDMALAGEPVGLVLKMGQQAW